MADSCRTAAELVVKYQPVLERVMSGKVFATLFFIGSSAFAGSAFASGYGPAPFYRPAVTQRNGLGSREMRMPMPQASSRSP